MPLTRFAPAPTGYLHLGHVANALYVWAMARARGARVLLRIEDHDRQRCRPEYLAELLRDLQWLGFTPDLGLHPVPYQQSDHLAVYAAAVADLAARGHRVYACACSRKHQKSEVYDGRCRERGLAPGPGRGLRVVLPPGVELFDDLRLGCQRQEPARQCGDLLLRDRLGNWSYQFAVVVDDLRDGVDLVIRGEDLLDSTGRQLQVARMLGRERPPIFLHHPLIRRPDGSKLSKANRDAGVRELRAAGVPPEDVLGRTLAALELPHPPSLSMVEALGLIAES